MGHPTYKQLLEMLVEVRDGNSRSDPERHEARFDSIERIMQMLLEKMRDNLDSPVR